MRFAIKFAYNGTSFSGSQRQKNPELRTVEGDIITCLLDHQVIQDLKTSKFSVASRTDAKVSALGNVLALNTDFSEKEILNILNSKISDCWFYGFARVENDFKPRHAKMRWYRYHLFKDMDIDIIKLKQITEIFIGEHNFKNYSNPSIDSEKTIRSIDSIEIIESVPWLFFDLRASGFLWNQVRRLVSAWTNCAKGKISKTDLDSALKDDSQTFDFGLAPPEPLFLMDVEFDFEFEINKELLQKTIVGLHRNWQKINLQNFLLEYIFKNIRY